MLGVQWLTAAQWGQAGSRLLLLTWSDDSTVRLWDVGANAEIMRMSESALIGRGAANDDASQILTANDDGSLRVWDAWLNDPNQLLAVAKARQTRER